MSACISAQADPQQSLDFLYWLRPQGPWSLTAIPVEGGLTTTKTFTPESLTELEEYLSRFNGVQNLYYMINPSIGTLTSKGKKEDVRSIDFLHVDVDPAKPTVTDPAALASHLESERARILGMLEGFKPAPSAIVDSGGGYQALWRLEEPIQVGGMGALALEGEAYSKQLGIQLGGDATHNCDRLLRLPGTINVPDEKKRKKGRTSRLARVVYLAPDGGVVYSLSAFPQPSPVRRSRGSPLPRAPVQLNETLPSVNVMTDLPPGVSPRMRAVIVQGDDAENPYPSRSEAVWAVTCSLVRAGCSDEVIASILTDTDYRISESILEKGGRAEATQQIEKARRENAPQGVQLDDFYAHMTSHRYIFAPTGELWPAGSVNTRLPPVPLTDATGNPVLDDKGDPKTLQPAVWLDQNRAVEQVTWCPGEPQVIADRLVSDGWVSRPGCNTFNLYRPPTPLAGDAKLATPWIEHVHRVYPDDADHAIKWMAHRVQRPEDKVNHALFLGGAQGIGKDTMLEPLKAAVGAWNFAEVSPQQMFGRFNGFAKSVVLRISEARDLGENDRFGFYDHMKLYTAAPPDVLRVDEKNLREHPVFNVCGVIITSNHKLDGIFLPADDRRHFVAWSHLTKEDFTPAYWVDLWDWYEAGGIGHVAAYLSSLDLSDFNAKAPPPKTDAFREIVAANSSLEDADLADALDKLGHPLALIIEDLEGAASPSFSLWLEDRRNIRKVRHRLSEAGYAFCANDDAKDGRFKVGGRGCNIYTQKSLSRRDALAAAQAVVDARPAPKDPRKGAAGQGMLDERPEPPLPNEPY